MIKKIRIGSIKPNDSNPRIIKDHKFKKLVNSIKEFPEMLLVRPIVVNEQMVILGGNQRFQACKFAKLKTVPVEVVDWSEEKQLEFIAKDNVSSGEWDWEIIANEWNTKALNDWGVDLPQWEMPHEEKPKAKEITIKVVIDSEYADIEDELREAIEALESKFNGFKVK
jgi:hypothetical protein